MTGRLAPLRAARAALSLGRRAAGGLAVAAFALTMVSGTAPALAGWLVKKVIDDLTRPGGAPDPGRAVWLGVASAAVAGGGLVVGYAGGLLATRMQNAVTLHVQERLYARINGFAGLHRFEDPAFADRLRLAEDAATDAPAMLAEFTLAVVRSVVGIASFVAVLHAVWPPMNALLAIVAVTAVAVQLTVARRESEMIQANTATQRRQLMYRRLLTDHAVAKEVRVFGLGDFFRVRMLGALRRANQAEAGVRTRAAVLQSGMAAAGAVVAAIGIGVVIARAIRGDVTAGDVTLFLTAVAAVQSATLTIVGQVQAAARSTRLFASYLDVMEAPEAMPDGVGVPGPLRTGIVLEDVWFRYDHSGPWILKGVDLTIPAGRSLGLVGRNGAGKSTIVKLLCRFYDPQRGRILWDGVDLRAYSVADLRRRIATAFQDFQVYDLTIAENIGVGALDRLGDRTAYARAAALAGLDGDVAALPRRYETLLSRAFFHDDAEEAGVSLSGGQNQRLALARTLMREDADLIILDEPSSGLDPQAEHHVYATLGEYRSGRTSVLISHRLGAMRGADLIVVLADGVVVERGTHEELVAGAGVYAGLYALQAASYREDSPAHAVPGGPR
ncbi:ABC transporter ATP-binding protein [Hamadaea tsunoensis]|uniref:ABC transporter ATP-binding protein n=1 Tax=Hamadaea tsunoensis TaxID=53368 RepID=UPI00040DCFB8|nr:ABC transporter ATP-binding protein [Hamadaea tsunoensis]